MIQKMEPAFIPFPSVTTGVTINKYDKYFYCSVIAAVTQVLWLTVTATLTLLTPTLTLLTLLIQLTAFSALQLCPTFYPL